MDIGLSVVIIILCIVGLWQGAVWLVESASHIARRLGMSELVIGLTVVAIGTSAPEFVVTISAALKGQADISLGNVVGSNIFNLGIILGLVGLFSSVITPRRVIVRDGGMLVLAAGMLLLFLYDSSLAQWEGVVLFSVLGLYLLYLLIRKEAIEDECPPGDYHWHDVPKLVIGIAVVAGSGHFLVEYSVQLAKIFGVSEWLIGVTIVAIGTSAPEFATSLTAVVKGRHGISLGNLIGSDLFNLLGVLGLAAIIKPLHVTGEAYQSVILMAGFMVILLVTMRTGWRISRGEAVLLLTLALLRWILNMV